MQIYFYAITSNLLWNFSKHDIDREFRKKVFPKEVNPLGVATDIRVEISSGKLVLVV